MTQPWMREAWSLVGQREIGGPAANPDIIALFSDAGHPEITSDETHWCAAMTSACLKRAGIEPPPKWDALRAKSYATFGQAIDVPRVGAIAVFNRDNNPALGHVGFVTGETEHYIQLLGGNQSNAVSVAPYPKSDLVALRWPQAATTAPPSRTITEAKKIKGDARKLVVGEVAVHGFAEPWLNGIDMISKSAQSMQGSLEVLVGFGAFVSQNTWLMGGLILLFFGARIVRSTKVIDFLRRDDQSTGAHVDRAAEQPLTITGGASA